jgi:hypothetical protein
MENPEKNVTTLWVKRFNWRDRKFFVRKDYYEIGEVVQYAISVREPFTSWYSSYKDFSEACQAAKKWLREND